MADIIHRSERLAEICRRFGIDIAYAFGSRGREALDWLSGASSTLDPLGSDLDAGVLPTEGSRLTVVQKVDLAQALEDLFGLPRVDLVCLPEADPFVAANIIRGERLFADDAYRADERKVWAAESCLRRALEALFDLGRHVVAKGFGRGVSEYREIARELTAQGVLETEEGALMERMAGYRNRMVHMYHDVDSAEPYTICAEHLDEVEQLSHSIRDWLKAHPDLLDGTL